MRPFSLCEIRKFTHCFILLKTTAVQYWRTNENYFEIKLEFARQCCPEVTVEIVKTVELGQKLGQRTSQTHVCLLVVSFWPVSWPKSCILFQEMYQRTFGYCTSNHFYLVQPIMPLLLTFDVRNKISLSWLFRLFSLMISVMRYFDQSSKIRVCFRHNTEDI